jgi:hypothetical protein
VARTATWGNRFRTTRALIAAGAGLLLLLIVIAFEPGRAAGAVIGFDDLDAPPIGGQGLTVNVQYGDDHGVTFNDLDAFDYPAGFAHSPTVGVEPCFGLELCQAPARADFTAPQNRVGVWVGYNGALAEPLPVTLTALDAAGNVLGVATATLLAKASPTPIQTHLTLNPPGETITRVEVSTESGYTGGLAVDDLEFPTDGPPPACPTPSAPTVSVFQPPGGLSVQNNQFLLRGTVDAKGVPLIGATVVAQSATTRTAIAYPTPIDSDGGQFGPINLGGLLGPGVNDVYVTASNCRGTGTSSSRQVTFSPIAAGTRIAQLGMIEITQAVQEPNNATPLIAGTATNNKRTFARVYLRLEGGAASISNITGRLTAIHPDGSRPGGPLSIDSLNSITVEAAATRDSARSSLTKSLNFELPPEWLAAGRLHLELDRLEIEGAQSTLPCIDCDNHFPSGAPAVKTFYEVPPVRIWLVRVPYTPTPGAAPNVPSQFDISMLASWLRRAYPTAEVRDTQMFMPTQPGPPGYEDDDDDGIDENRDGFLCDDLNSDLAEWVQSMQAQHPNTRYYGVVSDAGGLFMRGCAEIGGRFGSGPAGPGTFGWDNDGAYTDWYGGHEIGHMYGRKHPGFCDETDDDDSYPFAKGLIGSITGDFQGFDAGDTALGPPQQLLDWRKGWSDLMTYCDNQWISDYSYRGILDNLCKRERANCPTYGLSSAGTDSGLRRAARPAATLRPKKGSGRRLAINASLRLPSEKLHLSSMAAMRGLTPTRRPKHSPYQVELLGRGGRTLASYPIEPKLQSDLPAGREVALIDEVVRFDRGTKRVAITKGSKTLASRPVSASAPQVRVTSPRKGKRKLGKSVRVRWRGSDADRDRLTYTLLYSNDGDDYIPVAAHLRKRSYKVDLRSLPGGRKARFRVVANDGVLTGAARSKGKLRVPAKPPRVSILSPEPGASVVEKSQVQLAASVEDLQDANVKRRSIVWRSSEQGTLGRGATITTTLKPGSHEISVRAKNSAGRSAGAKVDVEVAAVPPSVDAILIP